MLTASSAGISELGTMVGRARQQVSIPQPTLTGGMPVKEQSRSVSQPQQSPRLPPVQGDLSAWQSRPRGSQSALPGSQQQTPQVSGFPDTLKGVGAEPSSFMQPKGAGQTAVSQVLVA